VNETLFAAALAVRNRTPVEVELDEIVGVDGLTSEGLAKDANAFGSALFR
jgi:hypothetical protein